MCCWQKLSEVNLFLRIRMSIQNEWISQLVTMHVLIMWEEHSTTESRDVGDKGTRGSKAVRTSTLNWNKQFQNSFETFVSAKTKSQNSLETFSCFRQWQLVSAVMKKCRLWCYQSNFSQQTLRPCILSGLYSLHTDVSVRECTSCRPFVITSKSCWILLLSIVSYRKYLF